MVQLKELFKNSNYSDSLFNEAEISAIESRINMREAKGKEVPYTTCLIRNKEIKLTPEEIVRQLYVYRLINTYGYPMSRLQAEYAVNFGREVKRADIVIMDKDKPTVPYIIIEVKKPKLSDGKEQLRSYCNATGAPIAVWTNGEQISHYHRKDPNYFENITALPRANEKLSDILGEQITYDELKNRDKIANERRSLCSIIKEAEDEVLANAPQVRAASPFMQFFTFGIKLPKMKGGFKVRDLLPSNETNVSLILFAIIFLQLTLMKKPSVSPVPLT